MHTTAEYVGRMSGELAKLANVAGLPFLAYLLKMAETEAQATVGDDGPNETPRQRASAFEDRAQAG
ncbi:hypothetical protein GGR25_002269 [Kaistia hirudinis]|uniref:Uncharacterized protein n=1 Tax=Kaistia hirudinis TaxID=1293440 RepID=A0A840ALN1_9HYPH|nr:hypothetical protein [Kaistia hirudinis]MBB3931219.1 hypothetical protein [Kaistia hirudinis]